MNEPKQDKKGEGTERKAPINHSEAKAIRGEDPSAWLSLTKNESVNYMVDALLDLPPHREFNKSELANLAGVSRNSVGNHIELLLAAKLIEPVSNTTPTRYRLNAESDVCRALVQLDASLSQAFREPVSE